MADARPGRPRDAAKDAAILGATCALLAERGYDAMTVDGIAEAAGVGKATVYRRWSTKQELAFDAVMDSLGAPGPAELPDTGSLREDLLALRIAMGPGGYEESIAGLITVLREQPELAVELKKRFIATRADLAVRLLRRAQERGIVPPERDPELIASVLQGAISRRKLVDGLPLDDVFVTRLIDEVALPLAVGRVELPGT